MKLRTLERWAWYVFLVTLAWQTRYIVWHADSLFIEWRAISLYASDMAMGALVALALMRGWRPTVTNWYDWLLGFVIAAAVLSLGNADQLTVGLYQLARLIQFILFYIYMKRWALRTFNIDESAAAFVVGALGQSVLGIAQYLLQHDVGIRWLGETLLRTDMRGVAVFYDLAHEKVLRAYGTLPHPNVLAAYLMLATWACAWLYVRHGATLNRWYQAVWASVGTVLLTALFLTYSRTMVVAWLGVSALIACAVLWPRISRQWPNSAVIRIRVRYIVILILIVSACFTLWQWPRILARMTISTGDEAVRLRVMYNQDALSSGWGWAWNINWSGIGIGNFTTWLSRFDDSMPVFRYQPAHNVFLLVYSELGAFGLVAWLAWLAAVIYTCMRSHRDQPLIRAGLLGFVGALLFIALFDHFFWTLQQGRILWWMTLALAAGPDER